MTISYDAIGNPLSDGTWYYTWEQGRQLQSMESISSGAAWIFTYNADGMRTKRTNGSTTYKYTYHGSQLTHMERGSVELHFSYDASGSPMAVVYNNNTYYYLLNQQGDVVGILDSSGTQVVAYTYDAWGKPLNISGSMSTTLGQYNPLRYRGYVYDNETQLYYLQSRYYNPTWGRFINTDAFASTGQSLLGNNMFAYCGNNPVSRADPTGHAFMQMSFDPGGASSMLIPGPWGGGSGGVGYAASGAPFISRAVEQEIQSWEEDSLNAADFFINSTSGGATLVSVVALAAGISIPVVGQWILGAIGVIGVIWTIVR